MRKDKDDLQGKISHIVAVAFAITLFILMFFGSVELNLITSWFDGGYSPDENELSVTYYVNCPDGLMCSIKFKKYAGTYLYEIRDNEFGTPSNYEFVGWNTNGDGTGLAYQPGQIIAIGGNISLYAQWKSLIEKPPNDNDVNLPESDDDVNPDEDFEDNEKPNDNNPSTGDNSSTDKDPETDVDNPSLDEDSGSDSDGTTDDNEGTSGTGGTGVGSGSGNGGSTGNAGGNLPPNGNNGIVTKPNSKPEEPSNPFDDGDYNEELPKYKFKFYNKDVLYSTTTCEVLTDGTCMLVMPLFNPNIKGYSFIGWSLTDKCENEIITISEKVNSDKVYYACYEKDTKDNKIDYKIIFLIIGVWIIAGILIYFVIKRYTKNKVIIDMD